MIQNYIYKISEFKEDNFLFNYHTENIYKSLSSLNQDYPNFEKWYFEKVVPGIKIGNREIIMTTSNQMISGFSILKNSYDEKKICTLRVNPEFRKNGIGKILFEKSLEVLDSDSPVITVSQERVSQFSPLLKHYGFELSQVISGYYKKSLNEYVYNGVINNTQNQQSRSPEYALATT